MPMWAPPKNLLIFLTFLTRPFSNTLHPTYHPKGIAMHRRTLRFVTLLVGTFVLLITTAATAFGAVQWPSQQIATPDSTPLTQETLEQFWHQMYPAAEIGIADHTNVYTRELLAKAEPDECFNGIGVVVTDTLPDCDNGQPKVNESYIWGMTDYAETIWFGTASNVHCLVIGGYLGFNLPVETDSYVCEFEAGPYASALFPAIGDWRPPALYIYDDENDTLTDISPNGLTGYPFAPRFVSNTLGIRSAATFGDYVFFGGPAITPTLSINLFLYNAADRTYVGSTTIPGYGNIRKWLEIDGVLYVAVGTETGGAVLRYTGNPASVNPADWFTFEEIVLLDTDGAELALHEGRLFVNTWPICLCGGAVAGLWMSPVIPDGGLTAADAGNWEKVFSYDEYEPDPVIAQTYGGGALHSFEGYLYWGTMHIPFLATTTHLDYYDEAYAQDYEGRPDEYDIIEAMLGSQRATTIFQGRNFGTPDEEVLVAYGMPQLPAFDADTLSWIITDTLLGPPLFGLSGFNNLFNNYTWSMAVYDGQLFVGTMDWSYLVQDLIETLLNMVELPLDLEISLPDALAGADLYRFFDPAYPAIPESLSGVGNYTNYGVRNMLGREDGLYLGTANPMNLLTDPYDDKPEGGWELLRITRFLKTLTVELSGNGSGSVASDPAGIACDPTCSATYDYGSSIVLTPTAATGSSFAGWDGACLGIGACTVHLWESATVIANFTLNHYDLSVGLDGDGSGTVTSNPPGIHCGTACEESYEYGALVALTPLADDGSIFTGWQGACSGTDICEVTISETAHVTATFANNRFPLVVAVTGDGSVTSNPTGIHCGTLCQEEYDAGTSVLLTPLAGAGSVFAGWQGACSGTASCSVTISGAAQVTATFTNNRFPLVVNLVGDGSGIVFSDPAGLTCNQSSCSALFDKDSQVDLSAIAFSGSSFESWNGACSGTELCEVTITSGTNEVTATFAHNPQQLNLEIEGQPLAGLPLTMTATLNMNPIDECTWDFGDGESEPCDLGASTAGVDATHDVVIQTTHAYASTGVFVVIVTASNDVGSVVAAQQVTIQVPTAETPVQQPARPGSLFFPFLNR